MSQEFKKYVISTDTTLNSIVASYLIINELRSKYKINVVKLSQNYCEQKLFDQIDTQARKLH